uniref:Tyrosyl-DNA phosphodiesterase 1 n=1 Tax=Alexandrium monilatum TaxID=311494 RepID=A0A7S4RLX6_9DINO
MDNSAEEVWSGARTPPAGDGWYTGRGFWLNEIYGEELNEDDPRLTLEEKHAFEVSAPSEGSGAEQYRVFELPVTDARSEVPAVNRGALRLSDLNHDPEGLRTALFTTYDLVDDVGWLQEELRLRRDLPITLCVHSWFEQQEQQDSYLASWRSCFDDAVVHFPKTAGGGTCRTFRSRHGLASYLSSWMRSFSRLGHVLASLILSSAGQDSSVGQGRGWNDWICTVHSKLLLLEFPDRLRVAVTTANLTRTHWCFRGEAVWVQDFPRVEPGDDGTAPSEQPDASRILCGGQFAVGLAHFVADLLAGAPRGRRGVWTARLAAFDFSRAAAGLVPSLPGLFPRGRARPPGGGAVLRLWAERAAGSARNLSRALLRQTSAGAWALLSAGTASATLTARLSIESLAALGAAEELGLRVRPEVELFESDSWEEDHNEETASPKPDGEKSHAAWLVRAVVEGPCRATWAQDLPALVSCIEVDYGLFALRRCLEDSPWLQEEELHYAAISSSVDWLRDGWMEDFDACVGRDASHRSPGPAVIAPGGDAPLHMSYGELAKRRKLRTHSPPWHAPGRERVPNHSKIIARHLWDSTNGKPYGWVYLGSHNLTAWAWGSIVGDRRHSKLWVGNRELGVLLIQPRASEGSPGDHGADSLFAGTPLPFGLPLLPADIEGRELQRWGDEEEQGIHEWSWGHGGEADEASGMWQEACWKFAGWRSGSWGNQSWWQDDAEPSERESETAEPQDWRFRASSGWWWVP